ncbi:chorismate synthase [Dacryopinax primogenitus]|uniref:Chorismate synthase n=1 Tax=Dacryopinax primogenitus (strain DJM 731) TaxID=1858805 RepID=M5FQ34_DACPD|nr:chorismate synthase [Dacryopinax primogenitus]EJT98950.1 chorismate synthase [Dacryopinax primogenitus]
MSTFGTLFKVTTYGESHGLSVGCIVDGCPPGMELAEADVQVQLSRRRPGQTALATPRDEKDLVAIQSGLEHGVTLGTPISMLVRNQDQRPHDYSETDLYPRPSHADYTYLAKYGVKASSGGGRSSARETIGRVAAGAIAEKYLRQAYGIEIVAFVSSVGKITIPSTPSPTGISSTAPSVEEDSAEDALSPEFREILKTVTRAQVDAHPTRCPHPATAEKMTARIMRSKEALDSIGGTVTCVIRNVPSGLGEPVFDKFEAKLAHAMLSVPATKGFEIGSGFKGTEVPGSRHNDKFVQGEGRLRTETNWSGGIQGGITNGEDVYFRVGFKSPATISQAQSTAQYDGTAGQLAARGRHDPCVVPRAVPIVEAMAALVVMDALMIQNARNGAVSLLPPVTTLPKTMVLPK